MDDAKLVAEPFGNRDCACVRRQCFLYRQHAKTADPSEPGVQVGERWTIRLPAQHAFGGDQLRQCSRQVTCGWLHQCLGELDARTRRLDGFTSLLEARDTLLEHAHCVAGSVARVVQQRA